MHASNPTRPSHRETRAAAYGDLGKLLLAAESFADAESCFLNAAALNPADVRWSYYLAHVYRLQGESQKAASYFERALQSRRDDVAALVWLGDVYLDQGRPMDAGSLFSRALALDSRVAAARVGLGRVALAARDYSGAIEQLEAALALDPGATSVHYSLAAAYRGAGQSERADAHLRQRGSVQIGPPDPLMQEVSNLLRSPVAYEGRGDRALARGEFPRAVAEFRSGLELASDNLALRQKLATALSLTGDVQGIRDESCKRFFGETRSLRVRITAWGCSCWPMARRISRSIASHRRWSSSRRICMPGCSWPTH